jgi:uncharacterized RDD family membrane protein YckC
MDRDSLSIASATGVDVALPIAGAGSRSYAFLIDWHIRVLVALAWFLVGAKLAAGSLSGIDFRDGDARWLLVTLPAIGFYLLYHPLLEVLMKGRTPGKRMAGVRIVTRTGGMPSTGALLVRNVFRLVDCLPGLYVVGLVCTLVTRDHVRIGDLAAGTLLVHDSGSAVAALATFEHLTRETAHDPAILDIGSDLLRRWSSLEPARRVALAQAVLSKLEPPDPAEAADTDPESLRRRLQLALGAR